MTFAGVLAFLTNLLAAVQKWIDRQTVRDAQELGEHREKERANEADKIVRAGIDRADSDSVSDDEAFGPASKPGDDMRGTQKG